MKINRKSFSDVHNSVVMSIIELLWHRVFIISEKSCISLCRAAQCVVCEGCCVNTRMEVSKYLDSFNLKFL